MKFTPQQRWLLCVAQKEANVYVQAELIYQALETKKAKP